MASNKSNLKPVDSVDLTRYTGTWYEILRLPNRFEKGLTCITATYTLREDGKIDVLNKGHVIGKHGNIDQAHGKAWMPDPKITSKLKVSFFWPFSGNYWILYIDNDYKYVLVGEPKLKYLWILSRTPQLDEAIVQDLLARAQQMGYKTDGIIRPDQNCE
ncbi:MAG: lipocalin family protein [Syntrophothermus sp.]